MEQGDETPLDEPRLNSSVLDRGGKGPFDGSRIGQSEVRGGSSREMAFEGPSSWYTRPIPTASVFLGRYLGVACDSTWNARIPNLAEG